MVNKKDNSSTLGLHLFSWSRYFSRKEMYILFAVLLLGIIFRVYDAWHTFLWRDEIYIIEVSRLYSVKDLILQNHWDTAHPPLYFLFLHYWSKISLNPFFLRIPSLIVSGFALYLIPVLGKVAMKGKGLFFSLLFLVLFSFSHTTTSLMMVARPYPFVILLIMIILIINIGIVNKVIVGGRRLVITLSSISFLAFMMDYSAVWLLIVNFIYLVFLIVRRFDKEIVRLLTRVNILILVLCSLWIPIMLKGIGQAFNLEHHLETLFSSANPILSNLWQVSTIVGASEFDLPVISGFMGVQTWSMVIAGAGLLGLFVMIVRSRNIGIFWMMLYVAPLVMSFSFSLYARPIFLYRNLLVVSIAQIVGISYFLYSVFLTKFRWIGYLMLLVWLYGYFLAPRSIRYVDPPYDYERLTRLVSAGEGSILIAVDDFFLYEYPIKYWEKYLGLSTTKVVERGDYVAEYDENKDYYLVSTGDDVAEALAVTESIAGCVPLRTERVYFNYMIVFKCGKLMR